MKTLAALVTATAVTTASDEAKAVVIRHDGKPMRCEGYYDDWHNEFGCRYETPISCDDCVFVVGPQTGEWTLTASIRQNQLGGGMNRLPHKPHIYFANGRWHVGEAYGAWTGRAVIERNNHSASRFATKLNIGDK